MRKILSLTSITLFTLCIIFNGTAEGQTPLYFQEDNSGVYILLDGSLRHIPNPTTFKNLFKGEISPAEYIKFADINSAPHPIGEPIMDAALLVKRSETAAAIYLTDVMPWDKTRVVLRHVINVEQMNEIGFDWDNIQVTDIDVIDIPLATKQIETLRQLRSLRAIMHSICTLYLTPPWIHTLNIYFPPTLAPEQMVDINID